MISQKTILLILFAAFGLVMSSCSEDFLPQLDGEVQISFQSPLLVGGRIEGAAPAKVLITIEDALGVEIYSLQEMPLINFSGAYVTAPLALSTGDYKITQFLVTSADNATILASPISGSVVAYLVSTPLNINFSILADQVTTLSPEVLSTTLLKAEDFGYTSLAFTSAATFDFRISAQRNVNFVGWVYTSATIVVKGDGVAIHNENIGAELSQITVDDGYDSYKIIVSKPNYYTVSGTFTNAQMKTFFDNPLTAQLTAR